MELALRDLLRMMERGPVNAQIKNELRRRILALVARTLCVCGKCLVLCVFLNHSQPGIAMLSRVILSSSRLFDVYTAFDTGISGPAAQGIHHPAHSSRPF